MNSTTTWMSGAFDQDNTPLGRADAGWKESGQREPQLHHQELHLPGK
jgi:hypothetical protein